jgi:hypothetical protein
LFRGHNDARFYLFLSNGPLCRSVIYLDDASTDNSIEIVQSLAEECRVEQILTKKTWHRDEPNDRNMLCKQGVPLVVPFYST